VSVRESWIQNFAAYVQEGVRWKVASTENLDRAFQSAFDDKNDVCSETIFFEWKLGTNQIFPRLIQPARNTIVVLNSTFESPEMIRSWCIRKYSKNETHVSGSSYLLWMWKYNGSCSYFGSFFRIDLWFSHISMESARRDDFWTTYWTWVYLWEWSKYVIRFIFTLKVR